MRTKPGSASLYPGWNSWQASVAQRSNEQNGVGADYRPPISSCPRQNARFVIHYHHNDRLGTPVRLTDKNAVTVWRAEYGPFGDLVRVEVDPDGDGFPVENNLRLPGQYDEGFASVFLRSNGPYYNWNRWYDPGNGRFMQGDPFLEMEIGVLTQVVLERPLLRYAYVRNRPLDLVDRSGFTDEDNCINKQDVLVPWLLCLRAECDVEPTECPGRPPIEEAPPPKFPRWWEQH